MPEEPYFDDSFLDLRISFTEPNVSVWTPKQKLSEHCDADFEQGANELDAPSEARATYLYSRVDREGEEEAIIKIRMQ